MGNTSSKVQRRGKRPLALKYFSTWRSHVNKSLVVVIVMVAVVVAVVVVEVVNGSV